MNQPKQNTIDHRTSFSMHIFLFIYLFIWHLMVEYVRFKLYRHRHRHRRLNGDILERKLHMEIKVIRSILCVTHSIRVRARTHNHNALHD